jgi:nitrogen regulatory protein PII
MNEVKRVEIISDSVELAKIITALEKSGVSSYTILRNVAGRIPGSMNSDALALTTLDNIYLIAFCQPEQIKAVLDTIKPILNKFGGVCYVSDAIEIRSTRCVASL